MKTKQKNILLLIGFFYILITLIYFLGTSYTGYVIFEENHLLIDFSNKSEYVYDNETIEFSNSISLMPNIQITTIKEENLKNSYLLQALKDEHDVTDKVIALDNVTINIEKEQNENIFNVLFDKNLTDSNIIRLYIYKVGNVTADKIFLCEFNQTCIPPGYGEVYIANEGWYNLTITNLNKTTNSFNIDPEKIKFDYIDALYKETTTYNITNITYPSLGLIETENIVINGTLGNFIPNHTLNNQTINYYYSTDNGQNWSQISANLSNIKNTLIKFKIELLSDTKETPILHDIKIDFTPNMQSPPSENPPGSSGGGSGGGGGGGSRDASKTPEKIETESTAESIIIPLEELPGSENIIEPKIIKKSSEENILEELTGKAVYSKNNILNFLKSNLWILIFLIMLIIIYLVLHLERHKIHKFYKLKKK